MNGTARRSKRLTAPEPAAEEDDDATVKTADGIMRRLLGRPLPEDKKPLAGTLVHDTFGAAMGALYGGLAEVVPAITGFGLTYGGPSGSALTC
jgi:hypothetical protein